MGIWLVTKIASWEIPYIQMEDSSWENRATLSYQIYYYTESTSINPVNVMFNREIRVKLRRPSKLLPRCQRETLKPWNLQLACKNCLILEPCFQILENLKPKK